MGTDKSSSMLTVEIEGPVVPEIIPEKSFPDDRQDGKGSVTVIESSSAGSDSTTDSRTPRQKYISLLQFLALCWPLILNGWNDGSTGALLPRIQTVYEVSFGYISAARLLQRCSRVEYTAIDQIHYRIFDFCLRLRGAYLMKVFRHEDR